MPGARGERERRAAAAARRNAVEYATRASSRSRIYSRYRLGPALHWHLHLLGQLLGEFYVAKLREEKLRQASYLQAVHETGARMTHDIKNLLQSLNVLVLGRARDRSERRFAASCRRCCAASCRSIAQRLAETLEKLQRPQAERRKLRRGAPWWEALARQYRGEGVEFEPAAPAAGVRLPRSLFDSVADNLIRNALAKRADDQAVRVRVALECGADVALRVCDTRRARCRRRSRRRCCARRSARAAGWASACTRRRARPRRAAIAWRWNEPRRRGLLCLLTGAGAL